MFVNLPPTILAILIVLDPTSTIVLISLKSSNKNADEHPSNTGITLLILIFAIYSLLPTLHSMILSALFLICY